MYPVPVRPNRKKITPESEAPKEELPKKKHRTVKQINTIRIIHERVAFYDTLLNNCNAEPTPENQQKLDDYSIHLRNVLQLATYISEYIDANHLEDTLLAYSKIRKVITEEIAAGTILKKDGLLRNPKTNPYENVSATGNVIPILLPTRHIEALKSCLTEALIDEPVRILNPCNNMILIAETGIYTPNINKALNQKIFKIIQLFALEKKLELPVAFETTVVKYILR